MKNIMCSKLTQAKFYWRNC